MSSEESAVTTVPDDDCLFCVISKGRPIECIGAHDLYNSIGPAKAQITRYTRWHKSKKSDYEIVAFKLVEVARVGEAENFSFPKPDSKKKKPEIKLDPWS